MDSDANGEVTPKECMESQSRCRQGVFLAISALDIASQKRHEEQLRAITDLRVLFAEQKGKTNGRAEAAAEAEHATSDNAPIKWWSDTKKQVVVNVLTAIITAVIVGLLLLLASHGQLKGVGQ